MTNLKEQSLSFLILGAVTCLQIYFLVNWDNVAYSDAFTRLSFAKKFFLEGQFSNLLSQWLPGHIIFLTYGYGLSLSELMTRVLSLAMAATIFYPYLMLSKKLCHSKHATLISLILFAVFISFHHILSQTMSVGIYTCLLIWHWYFFSEFIENREKQAKLYISCFFVLLATSFRYEAWLFCALFIGSLWLDVVVFNRLKVRQAIFASLISVSFILFWTVLCWQSFNDPLYGITLSDRDSYFEYHFQFSSIENSNVYLNYLYYVILGSGFCLATIPLVLAKSENYIVRFLCTCLIVLICTHILKISQWTMRVNFRYFLLPILISFPLALSIVPPLKKRILYILFCLPVCGVFYVSAKEVLELNKQLPPNFHNVRRTLETVFAKENTAKVQTRLFVDTTLLDNGIETFPALSFYIEDTNIDIQYLFLNQTKNEIQQEFNFNKHYILSLDQQINTKKYKNNLHDLFYLKRVKSPIPYLIYEVVDLK